MKNKISSLMKQASRYSVKALKCEHKGWREQSIDYWAQASTYQYIASKYFKYL